MMVKYKTFILSILILLLTNLALAADSDKTLKAAFLLGHSIEGMVQNNNIVESQAQKLLFTIGTIEASNLEFMGLKCASEILSENAPFCKSTLNFMLKTHDTANISICKLREILSKGKTNFRCGSGWRWIYRLTTD